MLLADRGEEVFVYNKTIHKAIVINQMYAEGFIILEWLCTKKIGYKARKSIWG